MKGHLTVTTLNVSRNRLAINAIQTSRHTNAYAIDDDGLGTPVPVDGGGDWNGEWLLPVLVVLKDMASAADSVDMNPGGLVGGAEHQRDFLSLPIGRNHYVERIVADAVVVF